MNVPTWVKKPYALALACFLLIPAITLLTGVVFNAIDPEIAAGHPNYGRNYRLLDLAKHLSLLVGLLLNLGLWILTCFFLLKSKRGSYGWMPLALLGPFGLVVLTLLSDKSSASENRHQSFLNGLNAVWRVGYEVSKFLVVWVMAFQAMVLKRDLMILYESLSTGISTALIIERQNASSGMWAFSEGLEVLYLVALIYLLWPLGFNGLAQFFEARRRKMEGE